MSENKSLKMSYDVAGNDFETAGEASAKIKKMLQRIGVPAEVVRRIAIGTYEAEMNAIIHAGGGNVAAETFTDVTVITVSDQGPGIPDVDKALEEGYSTAPDYIRQMGFGAGMGLPNMVKCSDEFHVDTAVGRGTTIVMRFQHVK